MDKEDMSYHGLDKLFNDYAKLMGQKMPESKANKQAYIMDNMNDVIDYVRKGGYIVGSFNPQLGVSFSVTPVVHGDPASARAECKRLAQANPGNMFMFLKLTGAELVPSTTSVSI